MKPSIRNKIIISKIVLAIIIAIFSIIIFPKNLINTADRINAKKITKLKLNTQINNKSKLENDYKLALPKITNLVNVFPKRKQPEKILDTLDALAEKNKLKQSIKFESIVSPSAGISVIDPKYLSLTINLNGNLPDIINYTKDLNALVYYSYIDNVQISSEALISIAQIKLRIFTVD
ncbi:hypothetical protein AUK11_02440 [bacterium CG2_30_37_16]|nr:MAG: hypothetical protein AUK11_02440 [bacterium CG2_30_37_16]PIY00100.1 MAG: hypothetical protein COZ22_01140 [bacterium (Candidatus Howlettbacteria) CG_4_10_14_3_um_filter_37_10]PJB06561.1 MAG: hypothetical protein CO123_01945 [bacterium (Candidatus Howlettbacteria) CG_4_9_14_3_um_filter_37_10]